MCAAAASQRLATTETKKQSDVSLPLPPSHLGPETLVQVPAASPSAEQDDGRHPFRFRSGPRCIGQAKLRTQTSWARLSTASDFLLRLNAHDPTRAGMAPTVDGRNGR
jgi:hypothetical protein